MKALITGASSGIGRDMARYLASMGYDLVLVARREERLKELKKELNVNVKIIKLDLINLDNVYELYEKVKNENIDILINNAGFGLFGKFTETDLSKELEMINLNVITAHTLTKLFLKDFVKRDSGYILNVCSSAGFLAGPNLATYYATKNYLTKLTMAIHEELKHQNSKVVISALCPGPIKTEFNKVAKGKFTIKQTTSEYVAHLSIDKLLKGKMIIIPTWQIKFGLFLNRLVPWKLSVKICYYLQNVNK